MNETRKYPLWRNVVLLLEEMGVNYDTVIETEWLEDQLQLKRDTMHFSIAVSKIRRVLEQYGLSLRTAERTRGSRYVFLPAKENYTKLRQYQRRANDMLRRGVVLGSNTPLDGMSPGERQIHEKWLENTSMRSLLMGRSAAILKIALNAASPRKLANP